MPGGAVAPHYAFTHELYRQVVYEGIPEGRRRRLHQRIGEALESGVRRAGDGDRARPRRSTSSAAAIPHAPCTTSPLAAARARQRFANREAIGYLEAALALAALLPDEEERRRRELELRLALAQPLHELQGFGSERVRENAERAYELSVEVGNPGAGSLRSSTRSGSCMRCVPSRRRARWRRRWTTSRGVSGRRKLAWSR